MMSEKSSASKPIISIDEEGYIELHSGEPDNIITQLGRFSDKYVPWKKNVVNDIYLFTSYVVQNGYFPPEFKSSYDFVQNLREQSSTNPYVENYVDKGVEYLLAFLKNKSIIDENTKFLCIENNSELTDLVFDKINEKTNNAYKDLISLKEGVDANELFISDLTPDDVADDIEPILRELQKVDSYYEFSDLDFTKEELKYISGFSNIDFENFKDINVNDEIVLFSDVLSSGYTFIDVYNNLIRNGYKNIICFVSLIKQI